MLGFCNFVPLNIIISSYKNTEQFAVKAFFLIDLSTNEILLATCFFFEITKTWNWKPANNQDRFIKPSLVAKIVDEKLWTCFPKRETSPPFSTLILHIDRGSKFVSRPCNQLFTNFKSILSYLGLLALCITPSLILWWKGSSKISWKCFKIYLELNFLILKIKTYDWF